VGDARSSRETTPETETGSEDEGSLHQPGTSTLAAESQTLMNRKEVKSPSPLPPPRPLPFGNKRVRDATVKPKPKSPEPVLGSDEETASEDDEL